MTKQRTMSHSQKELYKTCKRKWYYQYIEGVEDDRPTSKALMFGSYVHEILEQYMREHYQSFGTELIDFLRLDVILDEVFISLHGSEVLSANDTKSAYALASHGLTVLQKDCREILLLQPKGRSAIELKLTYGTVYTGIIDLIYIDKKGRIVLLDWKTTSWGREYTNHKVKQSKQLQGYAWLVKKELRLSIDMVAYGVLDKKEQTAHIMKVKNTKDFRDFENELKQLKRERLYRGESLGSFQRNEEACFNYHSECLFYPSCWGEDKRFVETIDLVPSLG